MQIIDVERSEIDGAAGVSMATLAPWGGAAGSRVHLAYLTKGAVLPKHAAGSAQLFVMVSGSGLVAGDDDAQHPLASGQAARWNEGEEHTFWAVQESVAVIIQYAVGPGSANRSGVIVDRRGIGHPMHERPLGRDRPDSAHSER